MAQAQWDAQKQMIAIPKPRAKPKPKAKPLRDASPRRAEPQLIKIKEIVDPDASDPFADKAMRKLIEENAQLKLKVLALSEGRELSKCRKYRGQAHNNLIAVQRVGFRSRVQLEGDCTEERQAFERLSLRLIQQAAECLHNGYEAQGYDMSSVDPEAAFAKWRAVREKKDQ